MKIITVATSNEKKVTEIISKLHSPAATVIPAGVIKNLPQIDENGNSFLENSLIKAKEISQIFSTAVIADDSGLVVDALNGEPGIFSARYMNLANDRERYMAVLEKMKDIPDERRTARFVCAISFITPDGKIFQTQETCEGIISREPAGDMGFGYDPIFYVPHTGKTMAQLSLSEKNKISHRGKALDSICRIIEKWIKE